jgi:hypothetical protein
VFIGLNDDLLFEDDAVLRRDVLVCVLQRLTTLDLSQIKPVLVGCQVDYQLALGSVVRHHAFDREDVSLVVGFKFQAVELAHMLRSLSLDVEWTFRFIDDFESQVLHQVRICRALQAKIDTGLLISHFELVLCENVVFSCFKR